MSFELGLLMGLGRSAIREREERHRREQEQQATMEEQNRRSLSTLQKMVDTDDLLPDDARNVAAQHLFRLAANPKAKDKDFASAMQEVFTLANRPRMTPTSQTANAGRMIGSQDYGFLDAIAPGMGQATNAGMKSVVPHLPAPEQVSGILTQDEISARREAEARRALSMRQEFEGPKVTPFADTQGLYDVREGRFIRRPNPAALRPDANTTPFEALWGMAKTDDERRALAERALTMQYTNQGDQLRNGSGSSGNGPRYQRQVFQKPDGTYTEVLTNPYDPSEPPIRRDFGGGIDRPMNDATKNAKAAASSTIQMLNGILQQFDSGAVDPNEVFGKWNEAGYRMRASGWIPGLDPPDPEASNVRTDIANFNNELTKLRSGAAVSASEWARLSRELPIPGMAPEEVVTRLRRIVERLNRIYAIRYGPNGVGDANAFPGDVEGGPSGGAPRTTPTATTAPRRLPAPPPPPGFRPIGSGAAPSTKTPGAGGSW